MRELTMDEIRMVAGGGVGAEIAFIAATTWASGVAGFAAGSIFPGIGNVGGALVGGALGFLISTGYALATS